MDVLHQIVERFWWPLVLLTAISLCGGIGPERRKGRRSSW